MVEVPNLEKALKWLNAGDKEGRKNEHGGILYEAVSNILLSIVEFE